MTSMANVDDLNDYLDILGQLPLLKIYTQLCLCFAVVDASSRSAILNTLNEGLERLSASFPWIAGQVVNDGASEGNSGTFKIKPWRQSSLLVVRDLSDDPSMPSMDALRRADFPISMLDEDIIAPRSTLPRASTAQEADPVFLLQANFVAGGLLLVFNGQHNAMDMTGQGQIIDLFNKACRNEPFTREDLVSGNLARHDLIPFLDDTYVPGPELKYQIVKPAPSQVPPGKTENGSTPALAPTSTWAYFTFSSTSLAALKSSASENVDLSLSYISTDDALSAFVWQSVMRARLPRLSPAAASTFARAVDVRPYLGISATYPGLMQNMAYSTDSVQNLVGMPLGRVASQLRSALRSPTSDLGYNSRALATFLNRTPDKSIVSLTATLDPSTDIMFSSWAKLDSYDLDFNLGLGKPEAVRRPRFDPVESLMYLMPKSSDGEIAIAICLRDEDMDRLRQDVSFAKYGVYIG